MALAGFEHSELNGVGGSGVNHYAIVLDFDGMMAGIGRLYSEGIFGSPLQRFSMQLEARRREALSCCGARVQKRGLCCCAAITRLLLSAGQQQQNALKGCVSVCVCGSASVHMHSFKSRD